MHCEARWNGGDRSGEFKFTELGLPGLGFMTEREEMREKENVEVEVKVGLGWVGLIRND